MKHYFFAVTVEIDKKYYSWVQRVSENSNLLDLFRKDNIICAAICPSQKEAIRRVNHWNACYKANGTFLEG